ncbi:hypothetical protein [Streptomyces sp. NPDC049555]|uniref:DUF6928 family protein n=1 Tax=Streptomyces sp. NPDC049555 TaxID=3154930 RepID=UPI0034459537
MGSKAAIVAFGEAGPSGMLRDVRGLDHVKSKFLAERLLGATSRELGLLDLDLAVWPDAEVVCAASFHEVDVLCSRVLARRRPSELTELISRLAAGRNAYGAFMHSAEDWASFAVWEAGVLVRSVSVSPAGGIIEELGKRLPFEEPFWCGERPVRGEPGYALPFHPIDLGNEALRDFFGFILEGYEDDSLLDPEEVQIPAFRALS